MPRLTRAQLKAQAEEATQIHEDSESTRDTREASPDSDSARPVLQDITANLKDITATLSACEFDESLQDMAPKKTKGKKNGKKNAKKQDAPLVTQHVEVLEDNEQSDNSDAADAAAQTLRNECGVTEPFQVTMDTARPQTPPRAAVTAATRSLSKSPTKRTPAVAKTPKFDPSEHTTPVMADTSEQDSFAGTCHKPSPFKHPMSQESRVDDPDSFVEQIIVRSPAKAVTRIEDSVDAIDALEDAIEQVAAELPGVEASQLPSPVRKSAPESTPGRQAAHKKPLGASSSSSRSVSVKSLSTKPPSTKRSPVKSPGKEIGRSPLRNGSASHKATKPTTTTTTTPVTRKPLAPRPSMIKDGTTITATTLANSHQISFSNSPAKPRANMTHKRAPGSILSSVKTPFVPKPSSKPPTTSTFTLPGDAIAAKLKAEREERQKRMEAGENGKLAKPSNIVKRTISAEKKAPTAPSYQLPGDAVAAKLKAQREARLDREAKAEIEAKERAKPFKARPIPTAKAKVPPRENKASIMRMSSVQREDTLKRRGSDKENVVPSAPAQAPTASTRLEVKKVRPSLSGKIAHPAVSRRSMNISNQNVQERKTEPTVTLSRAEKEEAARKARAEAAERGRLASREWAEKQKKKMEATAASKVKLKRESAMNVNQELQEVLEVARMKGQIA